MLDAVGRALRLSAAEHEYVLGLGGYAVDPGGPDGPTAAARSSGSSTRWTAIRRSRSPRTGGSPRGTPPTPRCTRTSSRSPAADRNLLWLVFTDPYVRELLPDWDSDSRRFLAEFRADAGPRVGEPSYTALVARLSESSAHFAAAWQAASIERFTSRERLFHHPVAGELRLEHHQVAPVDVPDIQIVAYLPVPGTDAAQRLRALTD